MALYKFYDTDDAGTEVYDTCGVRYRQRLKACFQYCFGVSLCIHESARAALLDLEPFRPTRTNGIFNGLTPGKMRILTARLFSEPTEQCSFPLPSMRVCVPYIHGQGGCYLNPQRPPLDAGIRKFPVSIDYS